MFERGDGVCSFESGVELIPDLWPHARHASTRANKSPFFTGDNVFVSRIVIVRRTIDRDELT